MIQAHGLDAELASFQDNGFFILRGVIGERELEALRVESMAQIEAGPSREPAGHFKSAPDADGNLQFFRIESTLTKVIHNTSTLHCMAHPAILAMLSRILPEGFVCWADALLWKGATGGPGIGPHSAHQFGANFDYENLVVDVYLDESNADVGCLRVLPGSHKLTPEENLALLKQGWDAPGFVDVNMQPGDVLFHNEWMIHGSHPTPGLGRVSRRILYFACMDPRGRGDASRTELATHMRRLQAAIKRRDGVYHDANDAIDVVAPGFEADVAVISEEQALDFDAAAC